MKLAFQHKILAGFIAALVSLIVIGGVAWWSARQNAETFRRVTHTYEVAGRLQDISTALLNTESSSRGYAISGEEKFLAPFTAGIASVQTSLATVKQLTTDNPNQQRRLAELEPLIQKKINLVNKSVELRRQGDAAGALGQIASGDSQQAMDEIHKVIGAMNVEEESLLRQRTDTSQSQSRFTMMVVGGGSVAAVILVGLAGFQVRRDFIRRQKAEVAQRESEARYRTLFASIDEGFCIIEMIFDEQQKPVDYRFLEINPSFEKQTGLRDAQGKRMRELAPQHEEHWFEMYGRIATTGEPARFQNQAEQLHRWYDVYAFRFGDPKNRQVAIIFSDITARKRAEAALHKAHEEIARERARLQFIFDSVPIGIALNQVRPGEPDQDNRTATFINDAHLRICGLTREQAAEWGMFKKISNSEDLKRQEQVYQEMLETKSDHYSLDKRYHTLDGRVVWVQFSYQRRTYDDGTSDILTVVVDITERKQMEESLRRSEENLAVTLHSIGDAVLATDAEGRITRMNPIAEKLTGWTQAEALGHPIDDVFHIINEATRKPAEVPVQKVLTTGKIHGLANHTVIIARDGTECPIADSAAPIRDKDGRILGVVLVFRDVTEEKRAERTIADSERQLRHMNDDLARLVEERSAALEATGRLAHAAMDALSAHVAVLDESGTIVTTNKSWQDFAAKNDLTTIKSGNGVNYLEVCSHATGPGAGAAAKMARGIRQVIAGQKPEFTLEYDCHSPKEKRWFLCRVTRFPSPGPAHVVVAHENITQQKLLERQQVRNQRMESLGTLAGGVAHDLNNALAPIIMGVQMLKEKYPEDSSIVDLFYSSAKRGADMVRQLLTFARGAEGERNAIQVTHLIKEIQNIIKGTFPKNIQLEIDYDKNLPTVLGDATQLHQVLLNLCVNARDAMPDGGKIIIHAQQREIDTVYASSVHDAKPGKYVTLSVRDTGTGIPPEIIERIFDPFFTTKDLGKGTGLGLSTVMGIVKSHGGFLQVYSQPGEGATFKVFLPAEQTDGDTTHFIKKPELDFRGNGETILFVDDEAAMREIARAVLRRLNFNPVIATDGLDAIVQLTEHKVQLRAVITDLHMPHMDGLNYVRALRRMLPQIPVVVSSGRMEEKDREEFKNLGVSIYLDKPFTEVQLAEVLKQALSPKS